MARTMAAIHEDATSSPYEDSEATTDEESSTHNGENHNDMELQKEIRENYDKKFAKHDGPG
ncbi:hypothetical protein H5410_061153 [Solanum commersonii]|uniref:Uncharacterized protein n=1 Tax=Solanum commersonii TaxID=4109 RepID=A0A9J5W6X3_SOLCO|nr:hypothetical protein H5410_061153 [Solanum commersonii]